MATRILIVLLLVTVPASAVAQEYGIKGGLTLANVNARHPAHLPLELQWCCSPWDGTRVDPAVGVSAGWNVGPGVAIQAEVLFVQRGFNIGATREQPGAALRMSYIELPAVVQYVGGLVRVFAGGSLGIRTSTHQSSSARPPGNDYLDRRRLADIDASIVIGASLHRGRVSLEGRYAHGVRSVIRDAPAESSLHHKSLMMLVGYRLAGPGCTTEDPPRRR